jgi:hypothetical protein
MLSLIPEALTAKVVIYLMIGFISRRYAAVFQIYASSDFSGLSGQPLALPLSSDTGSTVTKLWAELDQVALAALRGQMLVRWGKVPAK